MYVGDCNKCIYGFKCPCEKSLNSAACLTIAKKGKPKQTNADRIRSMSDEELAMNMMCPNENGLGEIECDKSDSYNCYECILKWLQSEVE